jgi:putative two-component system response regulator
MVSETFEKAKILVVDDDVASLDLMVGLLGAFHCRSIVALADPQCVMQTFRELRPDLILLDLHMGRVSGLDVLREIKEALSENDFVPIVILTGDDSVKARESALGTGAIDYVTKPFLAQEVMLRLGNLLKMRAMHLELLTRNETLEKRVQERTRELEEAYLEIVYRLARAAEYRDDDVGHHTQRVGALSEQISLELGLPSNDSRLIGTAALLHDVGKIAIPDDVLLKPGRLSITELAAMQTHVEVGASILSKSRSSVLRLAEVIALNHHERWNGSGYLNLSGEEIPLPGRIVAVADVFDALISVRPYKDAWPLEDALDEIRAGRGTQFDPQVVDAFFRVVDRGLPIPYDEILPEASVRRVPTAA